MAIKLGRSFGESKNCRLYSLSRIQLKGGDYCFDLILYSKILLRLIFVTFFMVWNSLASVIFVVVKN